MRACCSPLPKPTILRSTTIRRRRTPKRRRRFTRLPERRASRGPPTGSPSFNPRRIERRESSEQTCPGDPSAHDAGYDDKASDLAPQIGLQELVVVPEGYAAVGIAPRPQHIGV